MEVTREPEFGIRKGTGSYINGSTLAFQSPLYFGEGTAEYKEIFRQKYISKVYPDILLIKSNIYYVK